MKLGITQVIKNGLFLEVEDGGGGIVPYEYVQKLC